MGDLFLLWRKIWPDAVETIINSKGMLIFSIVTGLILLCFLSSKIEDKKSMEE
jgi:hypothetical protein